MRIVLITALCTVLAAAAFALDIGKPSPPFIIQRLDGTKTPLTQFRGKILVLALIDTECPHCQNLTKSLNVIAKEYTPKGVQFVECAFNDGALQLLPAFIQKFQPAFPIGYSPRDPVLAYLAYSAVKPLYVPHLVFLDRRGVVQADYLGESDFMKDPDANTRMQLDKMLKAPATSATPHASKTTASAATPSHP